MFLIEWRKISSYRWHTVLRHKITASTNYHFTTFTEWSPDRPLLPRYQSFCSVPKYVSENLSRNQQFDNTFVQPSPVHTDRPDMTRSRKVQCKRKKKEIEHPHAVSLLNIGSVNTPCLKTKKEQNGMGFRLLRAAFHHKANVCFTTNCKLPDTLLFRQIQLFDNSSV